MSDTNILDKATRALCEVSMQRHSKTSHCCGLEPGRCVHKLGRRKEALATINAFLAAAAEQGWHMVKDEATKKMVSTGKKVPFLEPDFSNSYPDKIYRAMLTAAPEFKWKEEE